MQPPDPPAAAVRRRGPAMLAKVSKATRTGVGAGAAAIFLTQTSATVLRYAFGVLAARVGGVSNFGLYAYGWSWVQLLMPMAVLGFGVSVVRFVPSYVHSESWAKLRGLIRRSNQIVLVGSVATSTVATVVGLEFHLAHGKEAVLLAGFWLLPLVALVTLNMQLVRASQSVFLAYGVGLLVPGFLSVAFTVAFVLVHHHHLTGLNLLALTAASYAVTLPIQRLSLHSVFRNAYRAQPDSSRRRWVRPEYETRLWIGVSVTLFLYVLMVATSNNLDLVLVGSLKSSYQTGLYGAADRLAVLTTFIFTAVVGIVGPLFSAANARGDHKEMERVVRTGVKWSFCFASVVIIPLMAFPGTVLDLYGHHFAGAASVLRILAAGAFVAAVAGPVGTLLALTGHQKVVARASAAALVLAVALEASLLPLIGVKGAAIGDAASTIVWNVWLNIQVRRKLGIRIYGRL
jgi:O-antigen/teichoic acid export membrane protein